MRAAHTGMHAEHSQTTTPHTKHAAPYARLALMAVLSFVSMYVFMYAMVNALENVYLNVNQFYMAGLMTAPMVIIEMLLMSAMYRHKKLNLAIIAGSVIALALNQAYLN